ncbi:hypothetical protein INT45_011973 [Circinella minor]|uniref:F-box domain-containing protein n=1 Tax=Circinella minor TaxID=1195481 RepID=A0A8H7VUV2_9FUNG|nr:hypothetical protein INT45_011973 [Circinella minor]
MRLDLKLCRSWTAAAKAAISSPSRTRKYYNSRSQQQQSQQSSFLPFIYRLSDDVLLYLLLCPELDFKSLYAVAEVSQRFRNLVCQLLKLYLLPDLQLTTMMDQEGRGRWTCRYNFHSLDENTLCATFTPVDSGRGGQQYSKRYRCDGSVDAPTLRRIEVLHNDDVISSSLFVKDTRIYCEKKKTFIEKHHQDQHSNITTTEVPTTNVTRQARRVGIRRCGVRDIKSKHFQKKLVSKFHHSTTSHISSSWQLTYLVSNLQPNREDEVSSSGSCITSSTNNSNMSLVLTHDRQQQGYNRHYHDNNNKYYACSSTAAIQRQISRNRRHQEKARYITPISLNVDVSVLGQRSSNNNYKWFTNNLPSFCWIRQRWPINKTYMPTITV